MAATEPTLFFPNGFDEAIAWEAEQKGVYYSAIVRLPDGDCVQVGFYDPMRIAQDLESDTCCVAIPGMIVIPTVTLDCMIKAVKQLYRESYFDTLARLPKGDCEKAERVPQG